MSIKGNLEKVKAAVELDSLPQKAGNLGFRLRNAAIDALTGGIQSEAWVKYMSIFADNEAQLRRLTVVDEQNDPNWIRESRAYIVSNAVCGANTTTNTGANVRDEIDAGIDEEPDGKIVKPFPIP
jgi:hypothetical protein